MKIACLQFAPVVGDVEKNIAAANAILEMANPKGLDLLVLPEMAFSGYNFKSLPSIKPFLEPSLSGVTYVWARSTALKYSCYVTVGYPEKAKDTSNSLPEIYYNSALTINPNGEAVGNYRKSFLYYTDDTWASEGTGFFSGEMGKLGKVAMGICQSSAPINQIYLTRNDLGMDLNPYKFEAPWAACEFASHILNEQGNIAIVPMAWNTRQEASSFQLSPDEPCMNTLSYWLARLKPLLTAEGRSEVIVILANRTGVEDDAVYAGTSTILGIESGNINLYGILGRGQKELLMVDTTKPRGRLAFT